MAPFCPWGWPFVASWPFKASSSPPKRFKSLSGVLGSDGWRKSLKIELRAFCAKGGLALAKTEGESEILKKNGPFLSLGLAVCGQLAV